ncbi:unnamed protein product [Ixodes pacificus]
MTPAQRRRLLSSVLHLFFISWFYFFFLPFFSPYSLSSAGERTAPDAPQGHGKAAEASRSRVHTNTHAQRSTSCHSLFFFFCATRFFLERRLFDVGPAEPPLSCVGVSVLVLQSNFLVKVIANADNRERHFFLFFIIISTSSCSLFFFR